MGGGGVIRTVGKVAGIGAAASRGLRGNPPAPVAEHSARAVSRKVASIVSSNNSVSAGDVSPVSVQRPAWEIDDWEFAGEEGDLVMSSGEPMPRVVFGAAPSFEEAKAATDELKDAIEKVYLSSPADAESGSSTPLGRPSDQPLLSDYELDSKRLIFNQNIIAAPPATKHAVQAFKLLANSPAAQNVVASIASDQNVWNAVLQNEALMDFLETQKSTVEFPSDGLNMKNSVEDGGAPQDVISIKSFDKSACNSNSGNKVNASKLSGLFQYMKHAVEDAVEGVKHTVEEMVSNVSGLFQHIFGLKADGKTDTAGGTGDGGPPFGGTTVQQSLLGLAVLAILVILLKRV